MHKYVLIVCSVFLYLHCSLALRAQELSLQDAIAVARKSSVRAKEIKESYISDYWSWRAYRASRLPSVDIYGNLMNYDRSLTLLQSPENGVMYYVGSHNLRNSIGLRVSQNVVWTGGTVTLYTDLNRIDQFGTDVSYTWYARPVMLSYNQPLFAYNRFKWEKKLAPNEYERGKRAYIESMEQLSLDVVAAFFNLAQAQEEVSAARTNLVNTARLVGISKERLSLGTIAKDEYLQLQLKMLNDSLSVSECELKEAEARMSLGSVLGMGADMNLIRVSAESELLDVLVDYDEIVDVAIQNSRLSIDNEIKLLDAESVVEKAKAESGVSASLFATFGLSKSSSVLKDALFSPLDQEVLGLSFLIPVVDWGLGKGKIQKAKAAREVIIAQARQSEDNFKRSLFVAAGQFNMQRHQCEVSRRAMSIAIERYELTIEKYRDAEATVLDINTACSEKDAAIKRYYEDLKKYWEYYYSLRKDTLFDFAEGKNLDVDENEMISGI